MDKNILLVIFWGLGWRFLSSSGDSNLITVIILGALIGIYLQ